MHVLLRRAAVCEGGAARAALEARARTGSHHPQRVHHVLVLLQAPLALERPAVLVLSGRSLSPTDSTCS